MTGIDSKPTYCDRLRGAAIWCLRRRSSPSSRASTASPRRRRRSMMRRGRCSPGNPVLLSASRRLTVPHSVRCLPRALPVDRMRGRAHFCFGRGRGAAGRSTGRRPSYRRMGASDLRHHAALCAVFGDIRLSADPGTARTCRARLRGGRNRLSGPGHARTTSVPCRRERGPSGNRCGARCRRRARRGQWKALCGVGPFAGRAGCPVYWGHHENLCAGTDAHRCGRGGAGDRSCGADE